MKAIHRVYTAGAFALAAAAMPALAEVVEYHYYYPAPATTYYYYPAPDSTYYYTPPLAEVYRAPDVVVSAPRYYNDDRRITEDVVDVLASDTRVNGKIGVDTWRNDVTLTGRVSTPGQARIAERDAKSVDGVREVRNHLRTSVGGSP